MISDSLKILLLEDDAHDSAMVERELKSLQKEYEFLLVTDKPSFIKNLSLFKPDIIISDFDLRDFSGLEAMKLALTEKPGTPFIIITDSINEESAAECINAGAWDYVFKGHLVRLIPAIQSITKIKETEISFNVQKSAADKALAESDERYKAFLANSSEGIFRFELKNPMPVSLPPEEQIDWMYNEGYIAECNLAMAKMYGYDDPSAFVGQRLESFLVPGNQENKSHLIEFIENNYHISDSESVEKDKDGIIKHFLNNLMGIVENKHLLRIWGTQRDITRLKKAEKALRYSEERFKELFNNSLIGIYRTSIDGKIILANPALVKMLGYDSFEELKNIDIQNNYFSSSKARKEFIEKFDGNDFILGMETDWKKKNKEPVYVRESSRAIRNKQGDIVYFEGTVEDISEMKRVQHALLESEELYRSVVESLSEGLIITDIEDKIVFANKRLYEMTGYTPFDLAGHIGYRIFFDKDLWDYIRDKNLNRFRNITEQYEVEIKKKDGSKCWVNINGSPYRNGNGEIIGTISAISDITEYKKASKALEESEKKYRSVVNDVREAIFQTDERGLFTFLSPYWNYITNYTVLESIGKSLFDFVDDEYRKLSLDEFISVIYRKKDYCRYEVKLKDKIGNLKWIEVNARLALNDNNEIIGTSGIISDIQERKLAEVELIKAKEQAEESDRMKSAFLAQMSHEIRTPLNIILSYNTILKEDIEERYTDESFNEIFQAIENGGKRLLRTIDLILNMSVVQAGRYNVKFEPVNLGKLISKLVKEFQSLANEKKLLLHFNNQAENIIINADEYTLSQALQNLIDNAIKYTNDGSVEVTLSQKSSSPDLLNDKIYIEISDTGIGVSEEFQPQLFEPFAQEETGYSRKFEGNGLGLSLTKKYIELNEGQIIVKSAKGMGSVFSIILNNNRSSEEKWKPKA